MNSKDELILKASSERMNWLEDVLAGLLTAGCDKSDIEVQEHPGGVTVVCVGGKPKYSYGVTVK